MVCCLHLKDFTQGKINADQALKFYKKGSNNWFTVLENLFLLTMHSGKYENAAAIVEEVVHHPRFHLLHEQKHETWKIFEAYINYLIPGKLRSKDFKIHKFLNEVPIYSKDKAGFYPAILIAQLLYLLELEDEDKLERNIESLRIFSSRNLSGKKAPRTAVFIKMLRQLTQYNYDLKRVNQRCEKYLAQLKDSKFTADGEIDSMEIIPYEQAWVIILSRLQEKRIGSNMKRV